MSSDLAAIKKRKRKHGQPKSSSSIGRSEGVDHTPDDSGAPQKKSKSASRRQDDQIAVKKRKTDHTPEDSDDEFEDEVGNGTDGLKEGDAVGFENINGETTGASEEGVQVTEDVETDGTH